MEKDTLICLNFMTGRRGCIGMSQIFYDYSLYNACIWSKIYLKLNPTSVTNKLGKHG